MVMIQGKGGYPQISLCRGLTVFFFFFADNCSGSQSGRGRGPKTRTRLNGSLPFHSIIDRYIIHLRY